MIAIPPRLKEWRFILLKPRSKEPFELEWQSQNNYAFDDPRLLEHLKNGGNYGVLLGRYNNSEHLVLDADDPELAKIIRAKLPRTFAVRTGSGGIHFYYVTPYAD